MVPDPVWKMKSQTSTSRVEDRDTSEAQVTSAPSAWMLWAACQKGASALWSVLTGETLLEIQQRLLREREMKIRSALTKLRRKRHLLRSQRKNKEFPIVSVLGYTNCGEMHRQLWYCGVFRASVCWCWPHFLYLSRKNDSDQSPDWWQWSSTQKPAFRHPGCHRPRRPAAQSHDGPVRGHHRLPVAAASPAHRLLLCHPRRY